MPTTSFQHTPLPKELPGNPSPHLGFAIDDLGTELHKIGGHTVALPVTMEIMTTVAPSVLC